MANKLTLKQITKIIYDSKIFEEIENKELYDLEPEFEIPAERLVWLHSLVFDLANSIYEDQKKVKKNEI